MNFNFLRYVDKGTYIKITLDGGVVVLGKYEFVEKSGGDEFDYIHIITDDNNKSEGFQLTNIIQVQIPGD